MIKHYSIRLNVELLKVAKMVAVKEEITMQEAVETALRDWILSKDTDGYFAAELNKETKTDEN